MKTSLLLGAFGAMAACAASAIAAQMPAACCEIVELRQYELHPGKRETFIAFFEHEFIETQEAVGNIVIGQFRDLDNPNHFTWLRGFPDMPTRALSLQAFYGGDVWKTRRDAANAFFTDTDNVLLLHAVNPRAAIDLAEAKRGEPGATQDPPGLLVATIYSFAEPVDRPFITFFEHTMRPALKQSGIDLRGIYASETAPNNFPRLPVREKDHVFVWFAMYKDARDFELRDARLQDSAAWRGTVASPLKKFIARPIEVLRLAPTPRSRLHD